MKKKIGIIILAIIVMIVAVWIIGKKVGEPKQEEKQQFKIATTFYPIFIMTRNIVQDAQNIELVNMADVNTGCLHDYTLTTADMKKLEKANVVIQNGLGIEDFMDKILNTYANVQIIDSSKNVTNKIEENGELNNHIWTSISNYILQVEEIAERLIELNPENKEVYTKNKERYVKDLQELQNKYMKELEGIRGKKVICLNEALIYMAKEVGLDILSVETNHEESSLSAEKMRELIETMKEEQIHSILIESEDNSKTAETLAKETGATIYRLQSGLTGSVELNSYLRMMEENMKELKKIN